MKRALAGMIAAMTVVAPVGAAVAAEKPVSIVLVHGAFVDASGWRPVYDLLSNKGFEVLVVQNPTITLDGDAEATRQVIAQARHPVILVGHSYGGAVITQVGADPKVRSLVYLAAFAPDAGESVLQLASTPVPGAPPAPLLPPKDGFIQVDPGKFPAAFAADVDPAATRFMAVSQVPWGLGAVGGKITAPAWKAKPSYYLLATQDLMIPPAAQRAMAVRAKATLAETPSSHAVMLSRPGEVADFIAMAADASK
ncbi:alpha/beta fold hydrolase [Caulobacter endophyticus]|uniref:alpha/beta fold hydrolase n=1 Tax=Caulobacter endophyticus TaxID=2172652 RepID=UPI00240FDF81|nr:alpha/beta hydrolase [Caulobacter endophyticus]MDG2527931.1 alpha/beta hydrolase [Caulobacter endophyticus]